MSTATATTQQDMAFKMHSFGLFTLAIRNDLAYGYFEHVNLGEDYGGGLWFEASRDGGVELVDYDGVRMLPRHVVNGLISLGINVDYAVF